MAFYGRYIHKLLLLLALSGTNGFIVQRNAPLLNQKSALCAHSLDYAQQAPLLTRSSSRRALFQQAVSSIIATTAATLSFPVLVEASSSMDAAEITDKVYLDMKGLGGPSESAPQRLAIGLFGKEAPDAVNKLKQLVSSKGLSAPCKPRDDSRVLQKDQLQANKVYNACIEGEDKGVTYDYGTIWRIVENERIDVGSVSGKYIARQYPEWKGTNSLKHDAPGVVSVRRGDTSGFGFTIYPGKGSNNAATDLDENHVVIGKVLEESMDVVQQLNQAPVVTSAKGVNYMGLTGGETTKSAPTRGCYYGGPMYCNENKPLQKLSIVATGSL